LRSKKQWKLDKFLQLYKEYIGGDFYSVAGIDRDSVSFAPLEHAIWLNWENDQWVHDFWESRGAMRCRSPLFFGEENVEGFVDINFVVKYWVNSTALYDFQSWKYGLLTNREIEIERWHILSEQIWKMLWTENYQINPLYKEFLDWSERIIEQFIISSPVIFDALADVAHEKIASYEVQQLHHEALENEERRCRESLMNNKMILSHELYANHAHWHGGGKWREEVISDEEPYWKECVKKWTETIRHMLRKHKHLFDWKTVVYRWWAWSPKIDEIKDVVDRIYCVDKSTELIELHSDADDDTSIVVYWDYTQQSSIRSYTPDIGVFIGWDLGNQFEVKTPEDSYEKIVEQWIVRYLDQAIESKPDWGFELLEFFTDQTTARNFEKIYTGPVAKSFIEQPFIKYIDWKKLWVENFDWKELMSIEQQQRIEEIFDAHFEHTPELWEKYSFWRWSRLWFTVKKWKTVPLQWPWFNNNSEAGEWEYYTANVTTRINMNWLEQKMNERWIELIDRMDVDHDHWWVVLLVKTPAIVKNNVLAKEVNENSSERVQSKMSTFIALVIAARVALALWWVELSRQWLEILAERRAYANANIIEMTQQQNDNIKAAGIPQDTFVITNNEVTRKTEDTVKALDHCQWELEKILGCSLGELWIEDLFWEYMCWKETLDKYGNAIHQKSLHIAGLLVIDFLNDNEELLKECWWISLFDSRSIDKLESLFSERRVLRPKYVQKVGIKFYDGKLYEIIEMHHERGVIYYPLIMEPRYGQLVWTPYHPQTIVNDDRAEVKKILIL